jgi:hypothetical protein
MLSESKTSIQSSQLEFIIHTLGCGLTGAETFEEYPPIGKSVEEGYSRPGQL